MLAAPLPSGDPFPLAESSTMASCRTRGRLQGMAHFEDEFEPLV